MVLFVATRAKETSMRNHSGKLFSNMPSAADSHSGTLCPIDEQVYLMFDFCQQIARSAATKIAAPAAEVNDCSDGLCCATTMESAIVNGLSNTTVKQ